MPVENRKPVAAGRAALRLKRLLLLGWAAWWSVVFVTNMLDAAKALGLLGPSWPLASGNYRFLAETTARYGPPAWLDGLLFAGAAGWGGLAAVLSWRAWWKFPRRGPLYAAFAVGLGLWAAFLFADEVCIAYAVEGKHLLLFTAQLATLLAIELLPEGPRARPGPDSQEISS
jgi:hypothetical protein